MNGQQLSIFEHPRERVAVDPPRARREDPVTSQLAAAQADELSNAHYAQIRAALAAADGCTIHEIAALTGLTHVQVARRMKEMRGVIATPETRPSPSGRPCRVWKRA
jgi:hypothetical protein